MKRILTLILISAFFYVVGGPGIKQIKVDDNFFVITDTTTAAVQYRFPKSALYYKVSGSNVSFFNVFSPNSQIGQANYHLDSLVDGTNSTFANIDSLESWLRLNTGFNPAGSAATPTLDEVTSEGATTTNAISTGAISAPSIANPSGALAIVDDVDITGSLDVDNVNINGNNILNLGGGNLFMGSLAQTILAGGIGGTPVLYVDGFNLLPWGNAQHDFGSSSLNWKDAYLSGSIQTVTTTTPTDPSSSAEANIYVKGGKLVIQYNDAGTVRYKYLDLTGTGVTWTHTTTAP